MPVTALASFEYHETNVAARLGFSVALGLHLAAGPQRIRDRLAQIGKVTRTMLDGVAGWRVVEPPDEPTAITTLVPPTPIDLAALRSSLIRERAIVTTVAEVARAPFELTAPVLRVSPHVDVTTADLETFADALTEATSRLP
jgi:pyridoxal 5-phosphate dependent beta-lyase